MRTGWSEEVRGYSWSFGVHDKRTSLYCWIHKAGGYTMEIRDSNTSDTIVHEQFRTLEEAQERGEIMFALERPYYLR